MRRFLGFAFTAPLLGCVIACSKAPADVREWRPSDHDHVEEPNSRQVAPDDSATAGSPASVGLDDVTIVAWKQNCVTCHGIVGAGDGPQGAAMHAANLTNPQWQASVTDVQIATVIRTGKGMMPAFPLPEGTITGLVRLVRLLNAARAAEQTDAPAAASAQQTKAPSRP
jgi:mono/diheme cytochrome c family protein